MGNSECVCKFILDVFGFAWMLASMCYVDCFEIFLVKHAFQNMSCTGGCLEVVKKGMQTRHDVKLWHLAQVVLLFFMSMN